MFVKPDISPKILQRFPSVIPEPAKDGWYHTNDVNGQALSLVTGKFHWFEPKDWTTPWNMVLIRNNKIVAGINRKINRKLW